MRRLAAVALLLAVGCTGGDPEPSPTTSEPAPTLVPVPEPQAPSGPAATTAGSLDESSLPVPSPWEPVVREGSIDEGYLGNDSWVHEVDPVLRGAGTLAVGCDDAPPDLTGMVPTAALEGTLELDGAPGIVLALEFADDDAAAAYFDEYLRQLALCEGDVVAQVGSSGDRWWGRRDLGDIWSEAAALDGNVATFVILQAGHGDDELEAIADQLPGR